MQPNAPSQAAKRREVLQLLQDWRRWFGAGGGALPLDESQLVTAQYGPAGLTLAGSDFAKKDRRLLRESFRNLRHALVLLRNQKEPVGRLYNGDSVSGFAAWLVLQEVYFHDPGDPSIVTRWREELAALDRENALRRKKKKAERVALLTPRMKLEKHDLGIATTAHYLRNVDLYVVPAKMLTEDEEAKLENQYAEMYAFVQRLRSGKGFREQVAIFHVAEYYGVSPEFVERIIEFRSASTPDKCSWSGCDRAPYCGTLCQKHDMQERRNAKKGERAG